MPTSAEVYAKINEYLNGRISLPELEEWLAPYVLDILSSPDSELAYDVSTVELCLAEIDDGLRSARSAKSFIRKHLLSPLVRTPTIWLAAYDHGQPAHSSSDSRLRTLPLQVIQWFGGYNERQAAPV